MVDLLWPVSTHPLGFRNKATGEFSAFVDSRLHWGLVEDGGFLVSCPACFNASTPKHCDDGCSMKCYGAVLDYVVPRDTKRAATKTITGGLNLNNNVNARVANSYTPHTKLSEPQPRVVVLEGIVPYKWKSQEFYPTVNGEPLYTDKYGYRLSTEKSDEFSVFVGLFFGNTSKATEIYVLLKSA